MMIDSIADMLTRIRNTVNAKHKIVEVSASSIKKSIVQILLDERFIDGFSVTEDGKRGIIIIDLKYSPNEEKVISDIKRVSKPGLRIYVRANEVPKVLGGLGIAIASTSKGLIIDKVARKEGTGGEITYYAW